jgi:hypothetical protein
VDIKWGETLTWAKATAWCVEDPTARDGAGGARIPCQDADGSVQCDHNILSASSPPCRSPLCPSPASLLFATHPDLQSHIA